MEPPFWGSGIILKIDRIGNILQQTRFDLALNAKKWARKGINLFGVLNFEKDETAELSALDGGD
jgi:hypothetical protein